MDWGSFSYIDAHWENIYFQTDYSLNQPVMGQVQSEKTCTIGDSPRSYHTGFKDMSAHSGNNMFIVNGGNKITDRVWAQEINIESNTRYVFSLWAATIANGNPAKISFFVSDGALTNDDIINNTHNNRIGDPLTLPTNRSDFAQFYKMWNSNTFTGRKYITIVNQQTAPGGNDFAIDDISFGGVKKEDNSYFVNVKMNINTSQIDKVSP